MNKNILLVFLFLVIYGCGGKDSDQSSGNKLSPKSDNLQNEISAQDSDSDGDGIEDKDDPEPFIADVPVIGGEFFNKMKVELWSTGAVSSRVATWEINFSGIEVNQSLMTDKRPTPRSMIDFYLKKGARATNWKSEQIPLEIDTDYLIDSFASPMLTREEMLKISSSLFKRDMTATLSANINFQSDFSISSGRYKNFKDLTLSVFYLTPSGDIREFDSIYVPGQYEFNEVHPISNRIVLKDIDAVDALLVSGSRLFVKVTDFTVIETLEKYSDIIKRVRAKSLPLIVSTGNVKPQTYYVSTKGNTSKLKSIVERVFGSDQVRISSSSVDSIRGISNRLSRRDDWTNEFSQWVIGTNTYRSPFDFEFSSSDTITLGYYSNCEEDSFPVFMRRQDIDETHFVKDDLGPNTIFTQSFTLEDVSQKIEFVIRDDKFLVPQQKTWDFIENGACGFGDWMANRVHMKGFGVEYKTMDIIDELKDAVVEISNLDGIILREKISNSQIVSISRHEKTKDVSIIVNDLWKYGNNLGRIFARISFSIPQRFIQLGEQVHRRECVAWPRTPLPHRGTEIKPSVYALNKHLFDSQFSGLITILGY